MMQTGIEFVEPQLENLEWLYQRLADEESKEILVKVLTYRALGNRRVKLPLNNPEYWATIESVERQAEDAESIELGFKGWRAHKMDLVSIGYPINLFSRPSSVVTQFVLQQYRCQTPNGVIEVAEGDIVFDAGGCYGDTALYFAHKTGRKGKVYTFEFFAENLRTFRRNMELNPALAEHIGLLERPLWSTTGELLFVEIKGPGTKVLPNSAGRTAEQIATLSIDDFVANENLQSVDFIKMDIEGAELQALKGAVETLKRFKPKLAIAVYHNLKDFSDIPEFLFGLELGYRFYLRHLTIHAEETILFADVET
jgi:FkbM family methyltransferase